MNGGDDAAAGAGCGGEGGASGPRIDFRCPNCGQLFAEYRRRCPACGINLSELFSGQYHLGRSRLSRLVAWIIIIGFAACLVVAIVLSLLLLLGH
ncbi:MAG: hypothetical protein ACE5K7_05580 [Phycisphaerae bacterium]